MYQKGLSDTKFAFLLSVNFVFLALYFGSFINKCIICIYVIFRNHYASYSITIKDFSIFTKEKNAININKNNVNNSKTEFF